jgi:hypothetical protein
MRRALLIGFVLVPLAACNPPARAVSYFKANTDEAGKVLADCAAGTHRGAECDNAKAAEDQIASDKRLAIYRQAFQPASSGAKPGGSGHGQ